MRTLNIVGAGRLGRTLGRLWHEAGAFHLLGVCNRREASARAACDFIGTGTAAALEQLPAADVWLIATPESDIPATATALAAARTAGAAQVIFHCAGALGSDTLAAVFAGPAVASGHPLHSFADPARSAGDFAGSWCMLEGDAAAVAVLREAFEAIDARTCTIDAAAKPLYHAGSVVACNYLVALLDAAVELFGRAGIPGAQAAQMLGPILHATVDNALAAAATSAPPSTADALTGPIARGESKLVASQRRRLAAESTELGELYEVLGRRALALAALTDDERDAVRDALTPPEA